MDEAILADAFRYHPPDTEDAGKYQVLRDLGYELASSMLDNCPPCADRTAAIRLVREAVMTANASIALKGLI